MILERRTLFWRKRIGGMVERGDEGVGSTAKMAGRKDNGTGEGGEVEVAEAEQDG